MNWRKEGIIWNVLGNRSWASSHAMGPTPIILNDNTIRIYYTSLDKKGRGRPFFIDVDSYDPKKIKYTGTEPVLDIGKKGMFDDNGLMVTSLVTAPNNKIYMYYAGFEICKNIRYRILSGLAISEDEGVSFKRVMDTPLLERTSSEAFFRGGPFVLYDQYKYKLWYVAGSNWITLNGKEMPVYDLRYQESSDGLRWCETGTVSMEVSRSDEYGFGRPWVVINKKNEFELFYSVRRKSYSAYRLGYATSDDGVNWKRKDKQLGLDVSKNGFDSDAIMYSSIINCHGSTYCFYNGNDFGKDGIAVAILEH